MTQSDAVRQWWAVLDEVDRRRVLRVVDEEVDLLAEDLAMGLAMHGVTVVPYGGPSPVDGGPVGWLLPPVLDEFVAQLRDEQAPEGPGGRLCHACGVPVLDGEEWVEVPIPGVGLAALVHVACVPRSAGEMVC